MGNTPAQPSPSMGGMSSQPEGGKSKKWVAIVAILAGALLLAGGGAYAYTMVFSAPAPEQVLPKMTEALTNVTSFAYSGKLHMEGQISNPLSSLTSGFGTEEETTVPTSIVDVEWSGKTDLTDNTKGALTLKTSMYPADDTENRMTIGLEVLQVDTTFYLKLNQIPTLGLFDAFVAPFKGKWIKLEDKKLAEGMSGTALLSHLQKKSDVTPEQMNQLRQIITDAGVVKVGSKLSNQDGMYRYGLSIDESAVPKLLDDVAAVMGEDPMSSEDRAELQKALEKVTVTGGELLIGKDKLPYRIVLNTEMTNEKNSGKTTMTFTIVLKDYDKPVTIEAPTDAKTFEELFGGMMGGSGLGGDVEDDSFKFSPTSADDADLFLSNNDETDTDADGLYDREEKLMKTDPAKADTDGDGFNDYEEIVSGHDPLKKQ